jgi:hypothetical protein
MRGKIVARKERATHEHENEMGYARIVFITIPISYVEHSNSTDSTQVSPKTM